MILEEDGIRVLGEVVRVLEADGINYWLGRGLFRQFALKKNFGDRQGDIDFHILRDEQPALHGVVKQLEMIGYEVISTPDQAHKLAMITGAAEVEFVFLERDGDLLWHRAGWPNRKRYSCLARAFGNRRIEMFGIQVRVPDEEYLPAVFGRSWRKNRKGSGGNHVDQES